MYGASSMSEQERLNELNKINMEMNQEGWTSVSSVEANYGLQPSNLMVSSESNVVGSSREAYSGYQWSERTSSVLQTNFTVTDRLLNANKPLETNVTEMVTVNQQSGIYVNKEDEIGWNGQLKISDYPINSDSNPVVIQKSNDVKLNYVQPITVKYLQPPSPQMAGDIIIKKEKNILLPRAPPLIIRQKPLATMTPEPIVYREQPTEMAGRLEQKIITISGKKLPPPPRRLIIEKLPTLPAKPQPIIIEKWLQQERQTRKVKFIQAEKVENWKAERNLIINWNSPRAIISRDIKILGTQNCDPNEYCQKYSRTLLSSYQMRNVLNENKISLTRGLEPAVSFVPKLEGDLEALALIDLEKYGLSEYRSQLTMFSSSSYTSSSSLSTSQSSKTYLTEQSSSNTIYDEVFRLALVDESGMITSSEGLRLIGLIQEKTGKERDSQRNNQFIQNISSDGLIKFDQFKLLVKNWVLV